MRTEAIWRRFHNLARVIAVLLALGVFQTASGTENGTRTLAVDGNNSEVSAQNDSSIGSATVRSEGTVEDSATFAHHSLVADLRNDVTTIGKDPLFYGMTLSMVIGVHFLKHEDPELNELWTTDKGADHLFEAGDLMGNGIVPLTAVACSYSYGKLFRHEHAVSFASDLFRAQALNGIATFTLKHSLHRERPDGSPWSYPSGHTSSSFTTAAVVSNHFGLKFGIPAFVLATYVGLSRLQENRHYLSDVIAGAALGSYIGFKVARRRKSSNNQMIVGLAGRGITLTWKF